MRGFTDKALILLPKVESWELKGDNYIYNFKQAIRNILAYCRKFDMAPYCLSSDETANHLGLHGVLYDMSSTYGDKFFLESKCGYRPVTTVSDHPEIYKKAIKRYPVIEGVSDEEYLTDLQKRDRYITKKIIDDYKFVVFFNTPNNPSFSVKSREEDGRIVVMVNSNNFTCKCYISGNEIPCEDLLQEQTCNRPLCDWSIQKEGV